jgi:hypothetical protein
MFFSSSIMAAPIGVIGQWHLDGNTSDSSGGSHNGVSHGATAIADGICGEAYHFNGSSNINIGNLDFSGGAYTINVWYRTTSIVTQDVRPTLISKMESSTCTATIDLHMGTYSGSVYNFENSAPTNEVWKGCGTASIVGFPYPNNFTGRDGRWHMLTATFVSGEQYLYSDGVLVGSNSNILTLPIVPSDVLFGSVALFSPYHGSYIGDLDEVSIYNRVLTAAEVYSVYSANKTGNCSLTFAPPTGLHTVPISPNNLQRQGDPRGTTIFLFILFLFPPITCNYLGTKPPTLKPTACNASPAIADHRAPGPRG